MIQQDVFLGVAAYGFAMMLPLGQFFSAESQKLQALTIGLAVVGMIALGQWYLSEELSALGTLFILGFVAYQWIANITMTQRSAEF